MNQIMEALRNSSVNMIGLCGLGGVGKTTIAKEIARNQKMFEKAIMATVSNELNIENIQGQIAEKLGMQLNERTEEVRASRLSERLKQEKNMLLILDDLWVELDLHKVGIPFLDVENNRKTNEGCKLLLTSRNKTLLSDLMKCQKIIEVNILSEDEAWELFKRIAELSVDSSSPKLISIATDIVRKCGGLPLFISTLAKALRNKDLNEWENAHTRLNHPLRRNITGIKEADPILKLSYDNLSSLENKHIFLLASMLSHDPSIEDLLMYSMGLDFLEHTENIEDARVGLSAIVSKLKSLDLFLDSFSSHHVTMHDVIRDVALSIAFNELHAFIVRHRTLNEWPDEDKLEDFKGICLQESDIDVELPEELYGPRLKFFLLNSKKRHLTIPRLFFKSSKKLKVLGFTKVHFSSLPSLSYLKKLKTFCLHSCLLEDITEIRTLKNLKILSFAYSEIQRLPIELAELTSLQMLDLAHCFNLKVIPQELLSSLKKLEVLCMENSFDQWKVEGSSELNENACLDELKDLPISSLDIHIPNFSMLPENLFLNMNLKRYRILIGKIWQQSQFWQRHQRRQRSQCNHKDSKILILELERGIHLKRGVQKLLEEVEDLYVYGSNGLGNVLYHHEGRRFPHLRHLHIENNDDIKYIVLNSANQEATFPILERLILKDLKALEKICEGTNAIAFHQLRALKMEHLPALTADSSLKDGATNNLSNKMFISLFSKVLLPKLEMLELCNLNIEQLTLNSLSNLKTLIVKECGFVKLLPLHVLKSLNNLEELKIEECKMLKVVFDFEDFNDCREIESSPVVVPLKTLNLYGLPKLKNVWSNHNQGNVSFSSLRSVDVYDCERLTSIFPASSIAKGILGNLEDLRIIKCGIDVIVANDQASESAPAAFRFPKLTFLQLSMLRKLRNFYPGRHTLEWPNLQRLFITYCDGLDIFEKEVSCSLEIQEEESSENSSFPLLFNDQVIHNLEELHLDGKYAMIGSGLFSRYHFPNVKMLDLSNYGAATISYKSLWKSFPNLEKLELSGDFEVALEINDVVPASFSTLTLKSISNMRNLSPSLVSSQNLTHLQVKSCFRLTTLMTSSTAQCLVHITHLSISYCDEMEEIITKQEGENDEDKEIIFSKLKVLEFDRMRRLKRFCGYKYTFRFPLLEQITLTRCPRFKIFSPGNIDTPSLKSVQLSEYWREHHQIWDTDLNKTLYQQRFVAPREMVLDKEDGSMIRNDQFPVESCPQVEILDIEGFVDDEWLTFRYTLVERFSKLKQLHVEDCSFEEMFPSHAPSLASFHNLTEVKVSKCHQLVYLVTNSTAKSLVNLEALEINDCEKLKEIVKKETNENVEIESSSVVVPLKTLKLCCLPKLKNVWSNHSQGNVSFPSLRSVDVSFCESLTSIFPASSIAKGMLCNLEKLRIINCGIDVIVANDQASESAPAAFRFPKLTFLQLSMLQKLRNFYPGRHTLEWPNLQRLSIKNCDGLEIFEKEVSCSLEIQEEESSENSSYPLLFNDQVIDNLEVLHLDGKYAMIGSGLFSRYHFPNVKMLHLSNYGAATISYKSLWKSFPNLEHLELCGDFEVALETDAVVPTSFSKLTLQSISNMRSLSPSLVSSQNLTHLQVQRCFHLTTLMTSSTAQCLVHITHLSISGCREMEEIVTKQEGENDEDKEIIFSKLKVLKFEDMPRLKRFCGHNYTFSFSSLERTTIRMCPRFTMFCPGPIYAPLLKSIEVENGFRCHTDIWMTNLNNTIQHRFTAKKVISTTASFALNVENITLIKDVFPEVKSLYVEGFMDEEVTFPYSSLERFPKLDSLYVEHCSFEDIFPSRDHITNDSMEESPPFKALRIAHLNKLKSIWKDDSQLPPIHQNLTNLEVKSCCKLLKLAPSSASFLYLGWINVYGCHQLIHLVTSSTAKSLVSLKWLNINDCKNMEEIVMNGTNEDVEGEITFNELWKIILADMPSLKMFSLQSQTFQFPKLKDFKITRCPKMKMFCPGMLKTPKLSKVKIEEYELECKDEGDLNKTIQRISSTKRFVASREMVLDKEDASMIRNDQFAVESCSQVKILRIEGFVDDEWLTFQYTLLERFLKLEKLHVKGCSFHEMFPSHAPSLASFHNLTKLKVSKCHQLVYLVTTSTAKCLVNLETLEISDCEKMDEIVKRETNEDVEREGIIFNWLKLKLDRLPRLKTENFNIEDKAIGVECRNTSKSLFGHNKVLLPKLEISELSNLLNNSISLIWDEQLLHNSFSNLKTLIVQDCGSLKSLPLHVLKSLNKLEKMEIRYCDMLEMVFGFEDLNDYKEKESSSVVVPLNLTHLEVIGCHGLTTLMMPSAVQSLAHLTLLSISQCREIKEIITKQEGEDEEDKEIVFRKLEILKLDGLLRLKRFCGHNYTFSFSSLEHTTIRACPRLTMFCLGAVYAPLLKSIEVDNGLFQFRTDIWMTDLNDTIQHRFTNKKVISTATSFTLNAENITVIKDVFPKVGSLYVECFMDEGVTFPYSFLERFPKLDSLYVEHCSFEEIFPSRDHIADDSMEKIPPFGRLYIAHLDKLKSIWKDDSQLTPIHQNLKFLQVKRCYNLLKLAPSSASFLYLGWIKVYGCHQLIHLVTSSIAKSLVSLKWLEINDCKNMEEIVMNETNEDVEGEITFNQLWKIILADMPSLKMFSSQSHTFQFPKLKDFIITGCPEMKMFCPGVLKTPKLSKVKIEEHELECKDEGDLNKTIQRISSAKESVVTI